MTPSQPRGSPPPAPLPRPASIVAVLTPTEAREFLPEPLFGELRSLAPQFRVLDPTGMDDPALARELAAANPEVLVACWKTPRSLPKKLSPV